MTPPYLKIKRIVILCTYLILTAANPLLAAGPTSFNGSLKENSSLFWAICKVIGSLSVVVGLMILLIYFIKKSGITQGISTQGSLIKVLETKMVAPKKYIAIVEVAGKCLALGVTEQNINLLTNLDDSVSEQMKTEGTDKPSTSFAKLLNNVKASMKKKDNAGDLHAR